MKKRLKIAMYLGVAGLIGGAAYIVTVIGQNTPTPTDCSQFTSKQVNVELVEGLIVQNRTLLAVRLSDEPDYKPPGGHIELGETPQQALAREMQEEVGLKTTPDSFAPYKTVCVVKKGLIERYRYLIVSNWVGPIKTASANDKTKWVNYAYESKNKSDSELSQALYYAKQANLID